MQKGGSKLGWFISTRMILPKSPYNIVKMEIYSNIIFLIGNYMLINELKNPYEKNHLRHLKNVHVEIETHPIKIHPKMITIWTSENMTQFKPLNNP